MRIISKIIFLLMFLFSNINSITPKDKLVLGEAVKISLKNNNTYKSAFESAKESNLKVRETWGMLWPSLSTDAMYTHMGADSGFSSRVKKQYDIKFVNGQIAINPGIFYNSLQATRKAYIIAANNLRKIKAETTIRTIGLYYRLLLTKESVKMRRESLKSLEENLKAVTTGYEKGVLSRLDLLRAKVAQSNAKTMLINAENDHLSSISELNIQLGNDINQHLEIASSGFNIDTITELGKPGIQGKENLISNMISQALKNRPELIQIKNRQNVELYSAKANESIYLWPTFFINGNYGKSRVVPRGGGDILSETFYPGTWNREWSFTIGATYKWGALLNIDPSYAKSEQSKSRAKQTEYQLKDFIKAVKLEVKRGYLKLQSAQNSLEAQKGNIETAEESMRVSIIQFRNGIIDNTRLLEANVQLTTARTLFIQSLYNYQVAKAELNKAIGKEYFSIE